MSAGENHITFKTYVMVLLFLIFMTVVTVWVSGFDLAPFNMFVAMGIASVKAYFVLAYFMHLKYDSMDNRAMFVAGIIFLVIFFIFPFIDIVTRVLPESTLSLIIHEGCRMRLFKFSRMTRRSNGSSTQTIFCTH